MPSRTRSLLRRVALRQRMRDATEDLQLGLAAGACVSLAAFGVRALELVEEFPASWALAAGAATAVAFPLVGALTRRRSRAAIAATADERLGLAERMSTATWCETDGAREVVPLSGLVVQDADDAAASITGRQISQAFRPSFRRRPVAVAALAVLGSFLVYNYQPVAEATETEAEKIARLKDEDRIARVMRKIKEAAKEVEKKADEKKQVTLKKAASQLRQQAERLLVDPPKRSAALKKLNKQADETRKMARKHAGLPTAMEPAQESAQDKQLAELLREMAKAGLESIQKDMKDLQQRLEKSAQGDGEPPSEQEMQAMAQRLDALQRAMEMSAGENGSRQMMEKLASLGNEEMMKQISERLRDIAQKMSQGQNYESLPKESGQMGQPMELGQMTQQELQELLDQLDELSAMEDLAQMAQGGRLEMSGGRKLQIGWGEP